MTSTPRTVRPFLALTLAACLVALVSAGCRPQAPPEATPEIVDLGDPVEDAATLAKTPVRGDSGLLAAPLGELPDHFEFVERSGDEMAFADLRGRFAVVDFIFTSCAGPCPPMADEMGKLQERVRDMDDVVLVSVSVDPRTDTPEVLAEYAETVGADDDTWLFARMPIGFVNALTREEFLLGDGGDPRAHTTNFVLVDRQGRGRALYQPLIDEKWIEKLLADLEKLRVEAN